MPRKKRALSLVPAESAKTPSPLYLAARARLIGQGGGDNAQKLLQMRRECEAFLRGAEGHPFGGRRAA